MKFNGKVRALAIAAIAMGSAWMGGSAFAQAVTPTDFGKQPGSNNPNATPTLQIPGGVLGGEATGIKNLSNGSIPNGPVGPTPSVRRSHINDYRFQDEQLNLDANTGNVRVLRTDQKALLNDFVTATFEVKNVDPRELRNVLRTIVGLEGGSAEVFLDKSGKEKYIQVIAPQFMVPYLEDAIPALDQSWVREYDSGSTDVYYKAKNRSAADVDALASRYASLDQGFPSFVDTTNNAVSRLDEIFRIEEYLKAAEVIDIPANQVLLEVKIYEVASTNDLKLGLDYINWKNGPGRNLFQFIYQGIDSQSENDALTSVFDPFLDPEFGDVLEDAGEIDFYSDADQYYRAFNYLLPSNYIDFLQVKGQARVALATSQMVKSANIATFTAEDEVVALVSSNANEGDSNTLPGVTSVNGTRFSGFENFDERGTNGFGTSIPDENGFFFPVQQHNVDVIDSDRRLNYQHSGSTGIFVNCTPFVGLESMELVVDVQVGDMNGFAPNGTPVVNTRTVSSTVRLLDGEPYVIAGIKKTSDIKENAEAPGLGDIPILGYLFGGETDVKRQDDVVIVITPHFYLSSMTDLHIPQKVKDLKEVVASGRPVMLPHNDHPGYDQWLLDSSK